MKLTLQIKAGVAKGVGIWLALLLVICARISLPAETHAGPAISKAYQLKAVFLFNFTQFVDWPTNALPGAQTPFTIGVLGDDPFGPYLDDTVRGEKTDGHALVVQRYHRVEDATNCEILFISQSEAARLKPILSELQGRNILTVGDFKDFSKDGGVLEFVTEQNKIHFRINMEAAKAANLAISSKLLRLAEIINPGKE